MLAQVAALMEAIGQRPIVLTREVEGFVMNRLQGALLDEAMHLLDAGIVSVDGVDRAVKNGLGLRWSFLGPIETIDLYAPGRCGRLSRAVSRCLQFDRGQAR